MAAPALVALLCLASLAAPARASNEDLGLDARSAGMADAVTADPGLSALTLNPAALGHVSRAQLQAGVRKFAQAPAGPTDLDGMTLAVVVPLKDPAFRGAIGLSWTHDAVDPKALDRTAGLTYATRSWREFGPGTFDMGLTVKGFWRSGRQYGGRASKVLVDVGTYYRFSDSKALGLSLLNLNSPRTDVGRVQDTAPVILKVGYAQQVRRLTVAMDFTKREPTTGNEPDVQRRATHTGALGVEHTWGTAKWGSFTGRSGLSLGTLAKTWNLGAGWSQYGTRLDYAMRVPVSGGKRWGHAVSLSYLFGSWDPEGEYERLLHSELRYRQDLSQALESAEVKQWKLAEDLRLMRKEMEELKREAVVKEVEAGQAAGKLKDVERQIRLKLLEERRQEAERRMRQLEAERERMREQDKEFQFQKEWQAYIQLKLDGVSEIVLIERLKRILRQFQGAGVDLGEANRELTRLMKK